MGLDYCSARADGKGLTEEEYLAVYAGDDRPDVGYYNVTADGKKIVRYTLDFKPSRRSTLAML